MWEGQEKARKSWDADNFPVCTVQCEIDEIDEIDFGLRYSAARAHTEYYVPKYQVP